MDAQLQAGRRLMTGRSWSPFGKIAKVEYSLDGGVTWQQARLQEPGHYTVRVRAADEQGHTQPDSVPWNEQGYLFNAVVDHPLRVT